MGQKTHHYQLTATWTGNQGEGTRHVRRYSRSHTVSIPGKPDQLLTTDNPAVGDPTRLNPEDLLVTAISSCHLLSYLYVCALEGVVIEAYSDHATGIMVENETGGGQFESVTLHPVCVVADESMLQRATELHHKAHELCYIANSVNFPVTCEPLCRVRE